MLSVKPGAAGSFYILSFVSGLFFYYIASGIQSVCSFRLFVRVYLLFFFSLSFLLNKTQRGSGSQESAVERRPGPCAVVCVCVLGVRPSMVVIVLSVHCLPLLPPLSDVDCHVAQCECV